MHKLFPCYQNFDSLATFIRASSFSLFLQSLCFPNLYQSLRREWSIMGTQITWYCPVVNVTTSATWTCSFQPPVHAFKVLMNKNAPPPERTWKNLINIYWLTCSCAGRLVWSCTTLGITPLFYLFFIRLIFMPKAQAPYIIKVPPKDLLLSSQKVSTKRTWPLEL